MHWCNVREVPLQLGRDQEFCIVFRQRGGMGEFIELGHGDLIQVLFSSFCFSTVWLGTYIRVRIWILPFFTRFFKLSGFADHTRRGGGQRLFSEGGHLTTNLHGRRNPPFDCRCALFWSFGA